jgi:hypothetical protein
MASSGKFLRNRWRVLASTAAFGIAAVGVSAAALPSGATTDGSSSSVGTASVVHCDSGVVTDGDVSTSSALVARVPAGVTLPDLPGECVVTDG